MLLNWGGGWWELWSGFEDRHISSLKLTSMPWMLGHLSSHFYFQNGILEVGKFTKNAHLFTAQFGTLQRPRLRLGRVRKCVSWRKGATFILSQDTVFMVSNLLKIVTLTHSNLWS